MASIHLKFRAASVQGKEGSLYFQVIHNRVVRQINTGLAILPQEWDKARECILLPPAQRGKRYTKLMSVNGETERQTSQLQQIIHQLEHERHTYTADDIITTFQQQHTSQHTFFTYMNSRIATLKANGKTGCARSYQQTIRSLMKYRRYIDFPLEDLSSNLIEGYEAWLQSNRICRNTTSFYIRCIRAVYNKAIEEGLTTNHAPFRHVYTGVDRTIKRAVCISDIRRIKNLDLTSQPSLVFARDIFLLSFYLRGISFIDLAFLRKTDLAGDSITYIRHKTHRPLAIYIEQKMRTILNRYPNTTSRYLLPIILYEDGHEMQQYHNQLNPITRQLKTIGQLASITTPISLYVARHSWASIAQSQNIPLSVISGAMGHDNEITTQIYLNSIQRTEIDKANRKILNGL